MENPLESSIKLDSSEAGLHENLNVFLFREGTSYPTQFQVETTSRCNLKCPNCRRTTDFPDAAESQSPEILKNIKELLSHVDRMTISGWGESLMGRSLEELLEMARQAKVSVSITTNGTLLTDRKCRALIEKRVGSVTVSMDAGTPEGYARLRPGGVPFEKVVEGINRLCALRGELVSPVPAVDIAMVYYDDSANELIPLLKLVAEKLPKITLVVLQVLYFSDFSPEAKAYRLSQKSIEILNEARELAKSLNIQLVIDNPGQMEFDLGQKPQGSEHHFSIPTLDEIRENQLVPTCNSAWENPFIDAQGNVYPCCIYPESFGNINETPFEEIWQGPKMTAMRLGLHSGNPSEHCRNCRKTLWYPNATTKQLQSVVQLGAAGFIGMGWYEVEQTRWGTPFRWGRDRCDLFVYSSGEPLLFIEAATLPGGQELEVSINGSVVASLDIGEKWAVYTLPIPAGTNGDVQIGLRSLRPQKHPVESESWWPHRVLGVAVCQAGVCGSPEKILRMNPASFSAKLQRTASHKLKTILSKAS